MCAKFVTCLACLMLLLALGCNGVDTPAWPALSGAAEAETGGRILWGMWEVSIDADTMNIEIVPLRSAQFTANVTRFMQPPASPVNLLSISLLPESTPPTGYFALNVTVSHPFPGMKKFRGFDVRGILLSDGSVTGQHDSTVLRAGSSDTHLLNADGFTRWWNYPEFTSYGKIFGFTAGALAPPTHPTCTVNGYRCFADGLGEVEPVTSLGPDSRCPFSTQPGKATRKYEIQFKQVAGKNVFDFNYAVDASWSAPDPSYAPDYPEEAFSLSANCNEAYALSVSDTGSTAWFVDDVNKGGELRLAIEVFDHQAPENPLGMAGEVAAIWLEGELLNPPVNILPVATVTPGSGSQSALYEVTLSSLNLTHAGTSGLFCTVESAHVTTYEPQVPGGGSFAHPDAVLSAYFTFDVYIDDQPPGPVTVTGIDPDFGVSGFCYKDVIVSGSGFKPGAQVNLVDGPVVVAADTVDFIDSGTLSISFCLTDAPKGFYDVVVSNPGGTQGTLFDGYEVKILKLNWDADGVVHPTDGSVYWAPTIDDREPRLLATSSGQPFIGWGQWPQGMSAFKGGATTVDDGISWSAGIWQPFAASYHADTKLALDDSDTTPNDYNVYIVVTHRNSSWQTVGSHTGMARWLLQGDYAWPGEQGVSPGSPAGVDNGQEFIWTASGYPVYIRDKNGTIYCKVGPFKHSLRGTSAPPPDSGSWYFTPENIIGNGLVSDNRSVARDPSGAIHLAMFAEDLTRICLMSNPDGDGTGWNAPVIIHNEGPDGGTVHDPGIDITPEGSFRVAFRRVNVGGYWQVCYSTSPTGKAGSWTKIEEVYTAPDFSADLDRSAIDSGTPFDIDVVGIVFCAYDTIWYSWKPWRASSWLTVQVNSNPTECLEPDTIFTPNDSVHVVWSQDGGVKHDIWHRRGTWSDS